jgi:hypothetical protein
MTKAVLRNPASELLVLVCHSNIGPCHHNPLSFLEEKRRLTRPPCAVCASVPLCVSLSTLEALDNFH